MTDFKPYIFFLFCLALCLNIAKLYSQDDSPDLANMAVYQVIQLPADIQPPKLDSVLNEPIWELAPAESLLSGGKPDQWAMAWKDFKDNLVTWRAIWSSSTNKLYVAVQVKDDKKGKFDNQYNARHFIPYHDDALEFYTDGNNKHEYYFLKYDLAQQWRVSGLNHRDLYNYPIAEKFTHYTGTDFITATKYGTDGNWVCEAEFTIYT